MVWKKNLKVSMSEQFVENLNSFGADTSVLCGISRNLHCISDVKQVVKVKYTCAAPSVFITFFTKSCGRSLGIGN